MDEHVDCSPKSMRQDGFWKDAPGKSQRMTKFPTVVGSPFVGFVEGKDGFGNPIRQTTAEERKS